MVFQDPFASINPVFRVSHGIMRCIKLHRRELSDQQRRAEAERVLEAVGLTPAADVMQRFPHELSGGQRQRVGFAQALALRPKLIVADEPVSMLDVSIRIGLLNLMAGLRDSQGVSILYITHDIASARYVADRLIVMYAGRVAEQGPVEDILASPRHPYTQLLLSAVPDPRAPLNVSAEVGRGEPPRVIDPTPGLPVPVALPAGHRRMPPGDARAQRVRSRPRSRLPRGPQRRGSEGLLLTSSTHPKAVDSSRSPRGPRCRFAVHRRALVRKKAPRAATACPAAVLPADNLAIAADRTNGTAAHRQNGGRNAALPFPV